jgi:hypothetical protein
VIPVPFNPPDGDITILIGDWYVAADHKVCVCTCECVRVFACLLNHFNANHFAPV